MKFAKLYKKPGQFEKFTKKELELVDNILETKDRWENLKVTHSTELKEIMLSTTTIGQLINQILSPSYDSNKPTKAETKRQIEIEKQILNIMTDYIL